MDWTAIIVAVLSGVLGAGGIATIYVRHRLDRAERDTLQHKEIQRRYKQYQREWQRAVGRVLFWIVRSLYSGEKPNGELKKAYEEMEHIEAEQKSFEAETMSDVLIE